MMICKQNAKYKLKQLKKSKNRLKVKNIIVIAVPENKYKHRSKLFRGYATATKK
jgi:hypothetical protein